MPEAGFKPAISATSGQYLRLGPQGHLDQHKNDLHCLLKWHIASIHLGCDFCAQFQYDVSLITPSSKSYYGVLRMRDFPAGRLQRLKK